MQIIISGKGARVTEAIENYVNKKLNGLDKFFNGIIRADTVIGMETHHHVKGEVFFAECKLEVPGVDVFARDSATTLYAAIDSLRDHLEAELKKYKIKLQGSEKIKRVAGRQNKEYNEGIEEV